MRDADVFLFDEPLSNLDAKLRSELRVEIKRLHQKLGNTMIYVTHDQIEAMTLADRIAVMKRRRDPAARRAAEIYNRPVNRFVAGFIGSPAMNFSKAGIVDGGAQPICRSATSSSCRSTATISQPRQGNAVLRRPAGAHRLGNAREDSAVLVDAVGRDHRADGVRHARLDEARRPVDVRPGRINSARAQPKVQSRFRIGLDLAVRRLERRPGR